MEHFQRLTKSRRNLMTKRDVGSWTDEGKNPLDGFCFEVFMCVNCKTQENTPADLHCATIGRFQEAATQIQACKTDHGVELDNIACDHAEIVYTRQPEEIAYRHYHLKHLFKIKRKDQICIFLNPTFELAKTQLNELQLWAARGQENQPSSTMMDRSFKLFEHMKLALSITTINLGSGQGLRYGTTFSLKVL